MPSTARRSSVSPGHSRDPGRQAWRGLKVWGRYAAHLLPVPQPVPGGLVTWGEGRSLSRAPSRPGWSAALDSGAGSHVESPTTRAIHSSVQTQWPEAQRQGWRWGQRVPERRGTGQREEEAGGLEREGRQWGCIPTRAVLLAGGPRPGPSAAPPCTTLLCQHPLASPIRPASPEPRPGQGA